MRSGFGKAVESGPFDCVYVASFLCTDEKHAALENWAQYLQQLRDDLSRRAQGGLNLWFGGRPLLEI
jgi:hypothetical protein